ncbi:MAG: hypothetical protein AVDCRST_MAG90-3046 [uncultured Microvirga sp.]|uniref:Uncharacterized protein n=1 Tax=uncultured Microvirga sp. TaxID=412392 RepID=A0A6J4MFL3_9HYPH|nr:MAG: hypothetical protein AVDCRST_MAG90-3046 [uncultured Microvirga sp.]
MHAKQAADDNVPQAPATGRGLAFGLTGAAAAMAVAAGGLLWWRHGAAVFSDVVMAGLAWCF